MTYFSLYWFITNAVFKTDDPEFATFFIDEGLFSIEAEYFLEALAASEISSVSIGGRTERVGVISMQDDSKGKTYAWVLSWILTKRYPFGTGQ